LIGLDTNVLCRYLLGDDPVQTRTAGGVIEGAISRGEPCYISKVVLCELVWVLESCTSLRRDRISETIGQLLLAEHLEVEDQGAAHRALDLYRKGQGDLADFLIHESNLAAGCQKTVTFDSELRGVPGIEVL